MIALLYIRGAWSTFALGQPADSAMLNDDVYLRPSHLDVTALGTAPEVAVRDVPTDLLIVL